MIRRSKGHDPFEGFTQVEEIGRGSFATVYRAVDAYSGQPVALKLLMIASGRRFDTTMFELEARALGAVSAHPNIVTLHRAFLGAEGQPLLVLELCDGSLYDRLQTDGPLPVPQAVAVGVKLAGALETAHRAGILHRDLKPHNVLITRYGEPALADFGVAELRDTVSGGSPLSGLTLLHAAPEVILGHPATPASDVYGLVSTLYELISGRAPFFVTADEDPAVLQRRVLHDPVPRLEAPGLPPALRRIVEEALAKTPSERHLSAQELAQQLRAVEQDNGWELTPCRIDGVTDVPPTAPTPRPLPTLGRAAATTGIPSLGLNARPFTGQPLDADELEPAPAKEREILPTSSRDERRTGDGRSDQPAAGQRSPSETPTGLPPVGGSPTGDGPEAAPQPGQPPAPPPAAPQHPRAEPAPGEPPQQRPTPPAVPPTWHQPAPGSLPPPPRPPTAPPTASESSPPAWPRAAPEDTIRPIRPTDGQSASNAPQWGYATGSGLHETIGIADPNWTPDAADSDDEPPRRRRRRRRSRRR